MGGIGIEKKKGAKRVAPPQCLSFVSKVIKITSIFY